MSVLYTLALTLSLLLLVYLVFALFRPERF